jgi:hypothetical protein
MLKKTIVGTLIIGLTAILVIGAVYRTSEKSQDTANAAGNGHGQSDTSVASVTDGRRQGQGRSQGQGQGQGQSQGQGQAQGEVQGEVQAEVADWLTLAGVVEQIDESMLVVGPDSGESITVEGRPWRFAQEQGFTAALGDNVILTGFYDGELFEVGQLTNASSDQITYIREDNGRPLWAGGGRSWAVTETVS